MGSSSEKLPGRPRGDAAAAVHPALALRRRRREPSRSCSLAWAAWSQAASSRSCCSPRTPTPRRSPPSWKWPPAPPRTSHDPPRMGEIERHHRSPSPEVKSDLHRARAPRFRRPWARDRPADPATVGQLTHRASARRRSARPRGLRTSDRPALRPAPEDPSTSQGVRRLSFVGAGAAAPRAPTSRVRVRADDMDDAVAGRVEPRSPGSVAQSYVGVIEEIYDDLELGKLEARHEASGTRRACRASRRTRRRAADPPRAVRVRGAGPTARRTRRSRSASMLPESHRTGLERPRARCASAVPGGTGRMPIERSRRTSRWRAATRRLSRVNGKRAR